MASPDQYRTGRRNSARGLEFAASNVVGFPVPTKVGSPTDDDATPTLAQMQSRPDALSFLPSYWMDALAQNDDPMLLKGAEGLKLYEQLLSDDTVFSTLQQRRLAITSRDWEVSPGDDSDERSVKAAEEFRAMLKQVGFDRITGLLHYAVFFGYAVAEAIWTTKDHDGRPIVWLDDVVIPDRRWFGFTLKGELRMVSRVGGGLSGETLLPNKFLTVRTGGTHDFAFYGLGLGHWLYWPVFFKRAGLKFWSLFLEKLGQPTVAIEFTEAEKGDQKRKAELLQAAVAVGRDSAVLLPEGTLKNERIKIMEATRSGSSAASYDEMVKWAEEATMRVVLGQAGTTKGVSSGLNNNQATEHASVKAEIVKADSDLISEAINRTFARWVTLWNHGPDVAPPTVYRVLDDAEDMSTVAERDVKLNSIGIKRTEESVAEVYGDGYEVDRVSTEEQAAQDREIALAKQGAPGAPPSAVGGMAFTADDTAGAISWLKKAIALHKKHMSGKAPTTGKNGEKSQMLMMTQMQNALDALTGGSATKKRKAMEMAAAFAAQGGSSFAPLYVSRKLLNTGPLLAWAKRQGLTPTVPADDLHVTVLHSKKAVDWFGMAGEGWDWAALEVAEGGPRFVERFGDATVLRFTDPSLRYRHESMIERGASSDFPDYKPHVTISYDVPADFDLSKVEPFTGTLKFGPEIFEAIRDSGSDEFHAFSAEDQDAIDRLIEASAGDASPLFEAIGKAMRGNMQGVTSIEGARVALLEAVERFDPSALAKALALPLLAERGAAAIGLEDRVDG